MWSVQDATKEVLSHAKRPLSISEMTTMLRAAGVLKGTRSNAEAEVRSELIQDMLQNGRESTFVRVGNNTYALRYYAAESTSDPVAAQSIQDESDSQSSNEASTNDSSSAVTTAPVRLPRNIADEDSPGQSREDDQTLLRRIRNLSNQRFERFMVVFLASIGMTDIVVLNRMRPGELDIHASMSVAEVTDIHFSIQALNWHRDVHGGDIQLLRGGMRIGDHGLIVTTSDFQRGALEESNRQGAIPIATINGTRLAEIARNRGAARLLG